MDEREWKDLLVKRLYIELQLFKDAMLRQEKADIFKASYEIEIYVNLYEIFASHIDNLKEDTIRRLLNLNFGILKFIYQEWLTREDSFYDELRFYACGELKIISEMENPICGKECEYGKEPDKAA